MRASKAALWATLLLPGLAWAALVTDPAGDFLPTLGSAPPNGDLDVHRGRDRLPPGPRGFDFYATLNAPIGTTADSAPNRLPYVFGIDRGAGSERFLAGSPSIGAGVFFDLVVLIGGNDGSLVVNDFVSPASPAATVDVQGNLLAVLGLDQGLFPSTGFAFEDYTWNLWPRFGAGSNVQIADFAPNEGPAGTSTNAPVTVPLPSTLALLGLGVLGIRARSRGTAR